MTGAREPAHGAADRAPAVTPSATPTPTPDTLRVLVVDDSADLVESLSMTVQFLGHQVQSAVSGAEALACMQAWLPDVVLMDVGMPGMSGYEAASRARAESWGRTVVLVAMTGWGREEDRARAIAAGFDRHVVKPLDMAGLRVLLAELSQGR